MCTVTEPTGSGLSLHTVTSQRVSPLVQNSSDIISNLSTVPQDQASLQGAKFVTTEVLITFPNADFPSTLVYASNRDTGPNGDPRGDTIAVFTLDAVEFLHSTRMRAGDYVEWCVTAKVHVYADELAVRAVSIQGQIEGKVVVVLHQ